MVPEARSTSVPRTLKELQALVLKKQEAWISRVLYRKLSVPITFVLLRTPATPNGVTWSSAVVGLVGAGLIACPWRPEYAIPAGILLFQSAIVLDHVDGELARAKRMGSPGGLFLDNFVMEILLHVAYAAALGTQVYWATGDARWLGVGAAFLLLKVLDLGAFLQRGIVSLKHPPQKTGGGAPRKPWIGYRAAERFWEVKKMANATALALVADLVLARLEFVPYLTRWGPATVTGVYLVIGIPILAIGLLRSVVGASRGGYYVDLEPYK